MSPGSRAATVSHTLCAILLFQTVAFQSIRCQISDGDDQFEAVHQDIGRISGLSSHSQVAPKSTLVPRQPEPAPAVVVATGGPGPQPVPASVAQVFDRSTPRSSRGPASGASRKPARITLVARRDPLPAAAAASAQPTLVAAQLPAPPQQPLDAPTTYSSAASANAHTALNSFRLAAPVASPTSGSVSARHTALMAQVAAERAAAASLIAGLEAPPPQEVALAAPSPTAAAGAAAAQGHHAQPSQSSFARALAPSEHLHQHQPAPAPTTAQAYQQSGPPGDEPLVAPSFEHVLGHGCPHKGVFSWENRDHCDRYYMCTNGTFTEEACPNGLAYSQQGAVYQHCAYNWNVDCGRKKVAEPISSPGCPWQFGIFPIVQNGRCSIDYYACEWGVPETKRCTPEGLFYDDRIKGCQWADQLGCKSEKLLNFKCPPEDEDNPYWPYPRYYHDNKDVIVCVNEQPRLVHCNDDQLVEPGSLACVDIEKKKKKKKNF